VNGTKRQDDHLVVLFAENQDVTPDIILIVADHLNRIWPHVLSVASYVVTHETILLLRTPRFKMQVAQPLKLPIRQSGSGVRIRAIVPRRAPVLAALYPTKEVTALSRCGYPNGSGYRQS